MKKLIKRMGCIVACTAVIAGMSMVSQAAGENDLVSGAPVAGMAVTLSDYYTAVTNGFASKSITESLNSMLKKSTLNDYITSTSLNDTIADDTEAAKEETETEPETEEVIPQETETEAPTETQPAYLSDPKASVLTQYYSLGVAMPTAGYLNVRAEASTDSAVIGRMSKYAGMEVIVDTGTGWYQIASGPVIGYVAKEFILTGEEAKQIAVEQAYFAAKVRVNNLNFRQGMSTDAQVLTQLSNVEKYEANAVYGDWVELDINGTVGYVSLDCVTVDYFLADAVTFSENIVVAGGSQGGTQNGGQSSGGTSAQVPPTNVSLRQQIVNFAVQWQNPNGYRWGGSVLGQGVDCSGFTMAVMAQFGISLPHQSAAQAGYGRRIDPSQAQPGDLLFYSNIGGPINHVAIYIGNGQIVHAASERSGITISNWHYNTPVACVNLIG